MNIKNLHLSYCIVSLNQNSAINDDHEQARMCADVARMPMFIHPAMSFRDAT